MKEGFIKLDGQDKPQKMFYEPKQNANSKTLADVPKIQQCSHEQGRRRRSGRAASAGPLFWPSRLSAVSLFSRSGSFYFVLTL